MKNYLVEYCKVNDIDAIFADYWLIRAENEKDAERKFLQIIDIRYYRIVKVKEYNYLIDNMDILNFESYSKRYL